MTTYTGRSSETPGEIDEGHIVHATCVEQSDSYHYDEKTACGRYTEPGWRFWPADKASKVTCLSCLAALDG